MNQKKNQIYIITIVTMRANVKALVLFFCLKISERRIEMAIDFVGKFKRYLNEDGKSPKTIESYVGDIAGFVSYIQNMGVKFQGELKRFYVTSFRNYLIENQYETATINKKINSIQSFNSFLMKNNYTSELVVDLRKDRMKIAFGSEKEVEVFSEKQVEMMLFYIQNEDKVSKRDRMIILLLLYTVTRQIISTFESQIISS